MGAPAQAPADRCSSRTSTCSICNIITCGFSHLIAEYVVANILKNQWIILAVLQNISAND
jgi:hypothetical protein